ncbi:CAMP factor pore-forming toxin Cfu [Streptococcus uberis]|uniref:CAMP factor pore-forming toxin Cfu n=1 Tax=Streptococcus uberis TaxID=1349 RepID=UPI0027DBE868|nr:CAMP factor pore-forming toxin Cfu [Streptococcus uberis]MCK1239189.1 CAMP factor pore-forming toxin Cfu [Streptococcus uberis]
MEFKKLLYLTGSIAGITLFSPILTSVQANQINVSQPSNNESNVISQKKEEIDNSLNQESAQLYALKEDVKGTEKEQSVNSAISAVENLKTSLRANPETIYDLNSIGTRVEAISDVIEAIVFSTQQLTNKVDQAHIDMGFAITKLLIRIADPFASNESIKGQAEAVKQVQATVLTYPDLQPTDRATIYVKSKLDKLIWQTRITRDQKVLNVKSFEVYHQLNKAITHAVGVQLNPTVTVAQVDQEIEVLQQALNTALQ